MHPRGRSGSSSSGTFEHGRVVFVNPTRAHDSTLAAPPWTLFFATIETDAHASDAWTIADWRGALARELAARWEASSEDDRSGVGGACSRAIPWFHEFPVPEAAATLRQIAGLPEPTYARPDFWSLPSRAAHALAFLPASERGVTRAVEPRLDVQLLSRPVSASTANLVLLLLQARDPALQDALTAELVQHSISPALAERALRAHAAGVPLPDHALALFQRVPTPLSGWLAPLLADPGGMTVFVLTWLLGVGLAVASFVRRPGLVDVALLAFGLTIACVEDSYGGTDVLFDSVGFALAARGAWRLARPFAGGKAPFEDTAPRRLVPWSLTLAAATHGVALVVEPTTLGRLILAVPGCVAVAALPSFAWDLEIAIRPHLTGSPRKPRAAVALHQVMGLVPRLVLILMAALVVSTVARNPLPVLSAALVLLAAFGMAWSDPLVVPRWRATTRSYIVLCWVPLGFLLLNRVLDLGAVRSMDVWEAFASVLILLCLLWAVAKLVRAVRMRHLACDLEGNQLVVVDDDGQLLAGPDWGP
jgi:hypothetical protein